MATIPERAQTPPIPGLELLSTGKVRDTYALPDHPELLLVVASDRISIFDFVLPALVALKGEILTAINVFWRLKFGAQFKHDMVAYGSGIDAYLPAELRGNPELQKRATVVRKLNMIPVEAIVRGALTGTGLKSYNKDGKVCGHVLPPGLQDGDVLPLALFTPTTKAVVGHDEHIDADGVGKTYGPQFERLALALFSFISGLAGERGVFFADTKFEFGIDPETGELTVADEVATPDSSRFWDSAEWLATRKLPKRRSPNAFDKQFVRAWGMLVGIDPTKRNPANPDDVAWVHDRHVATDVLARTTQIYRAIFYRLTGMKLEVFQKEEMGVDVAVPVVNVRVVVGSTSDLPQMHQGLDLLGMMRDHGLITFQGDVISCHRNPDALREYARDLPNDVVVIAGAGLAAALPGVLQAWLRFFGKEHIPVIGVAFDAGEDDPDRNEKTMAAMLSIEQLPGRPVVLDEDGDAFVGPEGFREACNHAYVAEFLPPVSTGAPKPPERFELPPA